MPRSPRLHRSMAHLALLAMLLLVALPTAGRLAGSGAPGADGVWAQICTMAGLKLVKLVPGDVNPLDGAPAADPFATGQPDPAPHAGGGDCPYCPLLGGMALLLLCLLSTAPASPRRIAYLRRSDASRAFLHPSGLGSRGPPIALLKA